MDIHRTSKKPAVSDWHKADIKAALEKNGWILRSLARHYGVTHGAIAAALYKTYPAAEKRIAQAIGVKPHSIWPTRYNPDGTPANRLGNPNWLAGVARARNHATQAGGCKANPQGTN